MAVVVLTSASVDLHAVGRALGRTLDATVVDGDRLRSFHGAAPDDAEPDDEAPTPPWLRGLCRELLKPRPRPHVVATCSSLAPDERRALRVRCPRLLLVLLRAPSDPQPASVDETDDGHTVVEHADGRVEVVAAHLYGRLVARLEGISSAASDGVCSGRSG